MTVRVYRSSDASAPTLNGTAGALATVLDAILVNGYGSQTAAGWTIAYTGTNKRVYTMASGGTGFSAYVDDAAPGAGGGREARITGFTTPTGLGTGTGQFPTSAQLAIGIGAVVLRKSATADSTARAWTCLADGHTFYLFAETADMTSPFCAYPFMFGDFFTYGSSDTSNCIVIGRVVENTNQVGATFFATQASMYDCFASLSAQGGTALSNLLPGHYVAATFTNVGGSIGVGKHADQYKMGFTSNMGQVGYLGSYGTNGVGNTGGQLWTTEFIYPNGPDSGLYVSPMWIHHNGFVRGYLKGLWCPLQHMPLNHNDTYTGTGVMAGKSLLAQNILGCSNNTSPVAMTAAQIHIETSDTWS